MDNKKVWAKEVKGGSWDIRQDPGRKAGTGDARGKVGGTRGVHDGKPGIGSRAGYGGLDKTESAIMTSDVRGFKEWVGAAAKPMANGVEGRRRRGEVGAQRACCSRGWPKGRSVRAGSVRGGSSVKGF